MGPTLKMEFFAQSEGMMKNALIKSRNCVETNLNRIQGYVSLEEESKEIEEKAGTTSPVLTIVSCVIEFLWEKAKT